MTTDLGAFDGRDVIRTTISITRAGDGLSEALRVEPELLHIGQRVYVVLQCEVTAVKHNEVKDTEALSRNHVLRTEAATLIDEDLVAAKLAEQAEKIERARGIERLAFEQPEDEWDPPAEGDLDSIGG